MKPSQLILSTLVSLYLGGFVLTHSSWMAEAKPEPPSARAVEPRLHARSDDNPLASESGRRWRCCLPNHWRGYMLQH